MKIAVGYTESDRANGYSSFDGYKFGAKQTVIEFEVDTSSLVGGMVAPGSAILDANAVAEAVFYADNAPYDLTPDSLEFKIREALQAPGAPGHHSLSVGDTVTVDGVALACADMGFVPVAQADADTKAFLEKIMAPRGYRTII